MAIRPVTARSCDLARGRPIALIAGEAVDLDVRARRLDDERGPPRQLDLEVGRRPAAVSRRRAQRDAALAELDREHPGQVVAVDVADA